MLAVLSLPEGAVLFFFYTAGVRTARVCSLCENKDIDLVQLSTFLIEFFCWDL
jgi:hypothetical protein